MPSEQILVVDDSLAIVTLLTEEILPLGGYQSAAGLSGEEGIELAKQNPPDLILSDLEMPGVSGLEMLRILQEDGFEFPAIIMTAFGSEAIAAQALRMGVKDYIIKPFTTEEILSAVERALTENRLALQLETLQGTLEEQRQSLSILQAISQAAGSGLEPEVFMERIVLAAVHGGKFRGGYIARLNNETSRLEVIAVAKLAGMLGREIDLGSDPGLAEAIDNGHVSSRKAGHDEWIMIPLLRHDTPVGILAVVGQRRGHPPFARQLLATLAGYAAFAIENSKLRSDLAVAMLQGRQ